MGKTWRKDKDSKYDKKKEAAKNKRREEKKSFYRKAA